MDQVDGLRPQSRTGQRTVAASWRPWESGAYEGSAGGGDVRATFCSYAGPASSPSPSSSSSPSSAQAAQAALYCSGRGVQAVRIDPADGKVLWRRPAAGGAGAGTNPPTAPVLSGGLVHALSPDGARLDALDPVSDRVRWSRDVKEFGGRVYHAAGTVLLVGGDSTVTAVDGATGKVRWRRRIPGQTRPQFTAYGQGSVAYAVTVSPDGRGTRLAAVDPARGTTLWQRQYAGNLTPTGTGPGQVVYLTAADADTRTSAVVRYDPVTRVERWIALAAPVGATGVVAHGDMVYLLGSDGGLVAVDTAPGARRGWRLETSVANASQLVADGDRLYFSAADGRLLAVDTVHGKLIGQTSPRLARAGRGYLELVPAPVAADGKVFAAAPDGTVFAVAARAPATW